MNKIAIKSNGTDGIEIINILNKLNSKFSFSYETKISDKIVYYINDNQVTIKALSNIDKNDIVLSIDEFKEKYCI